MCRLIAVDGVDGAGKTVFGDALADALTSAGRRVIRASVDGFHQPRSRRYRRGRSSADGFFLDSYDYSALRMALLDPLRPGGTGRYRRAVFDHETDRPVAEIWHQAEPDSVLVLDGIFLHRQELRHYWDFSIFLRVDFTVSMPRLAGRTGCSPDPNAASNRRYVEGQRRYLAECDPEQHATVVVDNNDYDRPRIMRIGWPAQRQNMPAGSWGQ
jgi:uridine kinase